MDKNFKKQLEKRLERLEDEVFNNSKKSTISVDKDDEEYKGTKGGVKLLIKEGFFKDKRSLRDVIEAAEEKGYYYSRQAFHKSLQKLSKKSGPLVCLKSGNVNKYAKRK